MLQGIGGALLTPGALAILEASFARADRSRAIGAWSGLGGIGGALGPFLGGWLVEAGSWRFIFLINVPLALLVLWVTARHVPESRNPAAARRLDVAGRADRRDRARRPHLRLHRLAGARSGQPGGAGRRCGRASPAWSRSCWSSGARRTRCCRWRSSGTPAFTGANLVTFLVYAANGGVFFLVVINLQVVAGFSPLVSGIALLPVTVLMLLLSARSGALAQRIGPRIPMTVGPLICAVALLLMSRIGPDASYLADVLPAVIIFGLGLSLLVAPLTATALGALDDAHAGIASGVNNAVARAAGLLAVAVLPLAAGLGAGSLTDPAQLHPVYRNAMLICAGLMVVGGVLAFVLIPNRLPAPTLRPGRTATRPRRRSIPASTRHPLDRVPYPGERSDAGSLHTGRSEHVPGLVGHHDRGDVAQLDGAGPDHLGVAGRRRPPDRRLLDARPRSCAPGRGTGPRRAAWSRRAPRRRPTSSGSAPPRRPGRCPRPARTGRSPAAGWAAPAAPRSPDCHGSRRTRSRPRSAPRRPRPASVPGPSGFPGTARPASCAAGPRCSPGSGRADRLIAACAPPPADTLGVGQALQTAPVRAPAGPARPGSSSQSRRWASSRSRSASSRPPSRYPPSRRRRSSCSAFTAAPPSPRTRSAGPAPRSRPGT